jgi:hypothetical protein
MCFVARARACNADRSPSSAALDAVAVAVAVAAGALTKEVDMVVAGQERLPSDNNNTMLPHPFALIFCFFDLSPSIVIKQLSHGETFSKKIEHQKTHLQRPDNHGVTAPIR